MRKTRELPLETALNLKSAHRFAADIGHPLNHLVTIHFGKIDGDIDARRRWAQIQERARHWFSRRGLPLVSIWAHECSRHIKQHTHILIHLPRGTVAAFERMLPRWIGGTLQPGAIDVRQADGNALGYILKDAPHLHHHELGIHPRHSRKQSDRPIIGKRAGTSQNIGPAARAKAKNNLAIAA